MILLYLYQIYGGRKNLACIAGENQFFFRFSLFFYYIVYMTHKLIQINNNQSEPLAVLAKSLEEQANNIVNNNLKALEQNISELSNILDRLGVKAEG